MNILSQKTKTKYRQENNLHDFIKLKNIIQFSEIFHP